MNLKVANLIAIQLGIFVGIMSWLAYSRLAPVEPRLTAEVGKTTAEPVAPAAPGLKGDDQRPETADARAARDEPQPIAEQRAPVMQHHYSAAAVQQNSALAAQLYYQQIAPRRYASSGLQNGPVVTEAPSYAELAQETAVVADEPAAQTVAYVERPQVVLYSQPQFILFSNSRRLENRCRPASPVIGAHMARTHRHTDRPRLQPNDSTDSERPPARSPAFRRPAKSLGLVERQNDKMESCRPTQGVGPPGRR